MHSKNKYKSFMKKTLFLLVLLFVGFSAVEAEKIKVACVGNSVTYGYRVENREVNAYPAQLQRMLGDTYDVVNFGHSGATLLHHGHRPYIQQEKYRNALAFAADRVVIHLGLNDTDPRNWPNYRDEFVSDYLALIDTFRQVNPKCQIWLCRMSPIFHWHPRFKSGTRDAYWMIQKAIEEIAGISGCKLIDLQAGLYNRPDLLPDALHPNAEGAGILAQTVYSALTGDYGGLQLPILYTDNMVLQRDQVLRIAGKADTGEKVTVRIGDQQQEAIAGDDGRWEVWLDPLSTEGNPYTLSIATKKRKFHFNQVLAGDVWLCSGQSNMAFRVNESIQSEQDEQKAYAAGRPAIRLFDQKVRWETNSTEWDVTALDSVNRLQYYRPAQWTECNEETAARFSAVAFAFGQMLADSLQVPIGLILNAVGGSPAEAWIDRKMLEFEFPDILYDWKKNEFIQEWARGRAVLNTKKSTNPLQRHPYEPCYLYEAGIQPLAKYPIKGIIWYQGESNAHNREAHEWLFQLLVNSWRNTWGQELPFYYVQLSSIDRPSWTWFRDSQRWLLYKTPLSGMAVCSDRGDSLNVHPTRKKEVGQRLARWALHQTYGYPIVPSGPLYRSVEFNEGEAVLTFDYADGLQTSDGDSIRTFEIAEHDGLFVPAHAEVMDGKIRVWNETIRAPRFVRYGWQPFTRANLVNSDGLPASTFRTGRK